MGLPNDPQKATVWVDTYAAEFSRDVEPTVEMGDRVFTVLSACVQLYKAGETCETPGNSNSPCCTTDDKEIWNNVWSVQRVAPIAAPPAAGAGMAAAAKTDALPCPAGYQVDAILDQGDNGSCNCAEFCASDWTSSIKRARPHWTGSTAAVPNSTINCQCIQATHWCPKSSSCDDSCSAVGVPPPSKYCVPIEETVDCVLTNSAAEKDSLLQQTNWSELCAGTAGSSVFCSGSPDGRQGPFMAYSTPAAVPGAIPLYRCCNTTAAAHLGGAPEGGAHATLLGGLPTCAAHFLSALATCENQGQQEQLVGWMAPTRGGEMLRALRRCRIKGIPGAATHALDLPCLYSTGDDLLLGFVR